MARRRRPAPEPVDASPPWWLRIVVLGMAAVLIVPPATAAIAGQGGGVLVVLSLWPLVVLALIWRSRLTADDDGVTLTFLGRRVIPWSDIQAMVVPASRFGLRAPHLRLRSGRTVPLNPFWRADGQPVPVALEPWARRRRVRVEGEVQTAGGRSQVTTLVILIAVGALVGVALAGLRG